MSSLLVVGSIAIDTIVTPIRGSFTGLGGSATYFSAAASLLAETEIIAVLGEDFILSELDFLRARGVDLSNVRVLPGKTFQWHGEYGEELGDATTLRTDLNVFEGFKPELNERQRHCDFLFLANILPQLQLSVLEQSEDVKFVAADTMNLWINTENSALLEVLKRIDMLVVNESEARLLSGSNNIYDACRRIQDIGPGIVVVKRGAYGAYMLYEDSVFSTGAYTLGKITDPTGAGDTFAGGLMGTLTRFGRVDESVLRRGIVMGTALASFTIEDYSLDGLKKADMASLSARYRRLYDAGQIPSWD